jgi:ADP-L-glycero-D-manno-heptose 6-epimerase
MIIVTGGAGFIGSNLVAGLNARGIADILVVDDMTDVNKIPNVADLAIADYLDHVRFRASIAGGTEFGAVEAVFHEGACSDTTADDGRYVMDNNFTFSKELLHWCAERRIPFLYASSASVYGAGETFVEDEGYERPLNAYAYSKFLFDRYVRRFQRPLDSQVAGFRYFNVYGPRERHKGRMASVAMHFYDQYTGTGRIRLFVGTDGYADGEQRRDFVAVDDVVAVNLHFLDHRERSGIFNVGTGRSASFNQVAAAVVNACRRIAGQDTLGLDRIREEGVIEYVPLPANLEGRYQSYTQADPSALVGAGCGWSFLDVVEGVGRYVAWLDSRR